MKRNKLDKDEKKILSSFEKKEWKTVGSGSMKRNIQKYQTIAKATINKNKRINIRLTEKDYNLIKVRAIREGIPYQTLISSLIHKYLNGAIIEKKKLGAA